MRLNTKLLTYITIPVIVAACISACISYNLNAGAMRAFAEKDIRTATNFVAENVNLTISDIKNSLMAAVRTQYYLISASERNCQSLLGIFHEMRRIMPAIKDIFMLDDKGNIICSLNKADEGKNYSDRMYFKQARAGNVWIEGPLLSRASRNESVYIAIPIDTMSGKTVVVCSIELTTITNLIFSMDSISSYMDIILLDGTGKMITAKGIVPGSTQFYNNVAQEIRTALNTSGRRFIRYTTNDIQYTAYSKLINSLNWTVVVTMADDQINNSAQTSSQRSFAFSILAIVLSVGISSFLIYTTLQKLHSIIAYAKDISRGNLSRELSLQSKDELGELAESLRVMVSTLQSNQDRLRSIVEERTRQLKKSQENLIQETSLLKSILNTVPDLIFYKDMTGRYRGCNKSFCEFTGKTEQYIVGKNDIELFNLSENHAGQFINDDQRVFKKEVEVLVREEEVTYPDGKKVFLETIKMLYYAGLNQPLGMVGISRNIQLRKETEKAHAEAIEKAQEASKAKSEFVARISHEIRTPLNAIIGMNFLLRKICPNTEQQDYLHKTDLSAKNLLSILNDVLDFSKIEAGKLELEKRSFSFRELVREVVMVNESIANAANLSLETSIESTVPARLEGDSMRISQILLNLLSNAIKFSHNGIITIHADVADEDDTTVELVCSVQDQGIGMDSRQVEKLFSPFTQADGSTTRKYGGTGLGLSICKKLVELMNGSITVKSTQGEGTTFTFALRLEKSPLGDEIDVHDLLPHSETDAPSKIEGKKILLVEDNAINQEIALAVLTSFGLRVDMARNGREAVEKVSNTDYSLVLMDLQMPIMDGYQATLVIRSNPSLMDLPIIAMTANAMDSDRLACLQAGMNEHISKPFEPLMLKHTLEQWCR